MANEEDRVYSPIALSQLFDKINQLKEENKTVKAENRALKQLNKKLEKEVYRSG